MSGCHSGLVVGLAAGVKLVIPVGKFEPEKAMRLIQDERVTVWATVPTMVWRVVEHPDRPSYDLTSMTSVAYGGSPSAGELQRRVQETFVNVRTLGNAYGLTESSSVATVNSGADFLERPDSVGRPLPVVDVRIVDASGAVGMRRWARWGRSGSRGRSSCRGTGTSPRRRRRCSRQTGG